MPGYVYISYGRRDLPFVTALVPYLAMHGITGVTDAEPESTERWERAARPAVEGADAVVLVMSPASAASPDVARELQHAALIGKPVAALLLEGYPFPGLQASPHEDVSGGRMPRPEWVARLRDQVSATPIPLDALPPEPTEPRRGLGVALVTWLAVLLVAGGIGGLLLRDRPRAGLTTTEPWDDKAVEIGVDLPFSGDVAISEDTFDAMSLYLEQVGGRAGPYRVTLNRYNNAMPITGLTEEARCSDNGREHVARTAEVAVIGTFDAGCTKTELPILNSQGSSAMLMVSHSNSDPGLTKAWDVGEPNRYYPSGVFNFARVITPDDDQAFALAIYAESSLHLARCFVLNDSELNGRTLANLFVAYAGGGNLQVVGQAAWVTPTGEYVNVFPQVKAAGADCVLFFGQFNNHGADLMRDKVAVLGPNSGVAVLASDGFNGFPAFNTMPEADGAYLMLPGVGLDTLLERSDAATKFHTDFFTRYGREIRTPFVYYGVQALQVILAALERSDGTREGVLTAVFGGSAVTIPANQAILGKAIGIDPSTGDCTLRELTLERVTGGVERFQGVISITE